MHKIMFMLSSYSAITMDYCDSEVIMSLACSNVSEWVFVMNNGIAWMQINTKWINYTIIIINIIFTLIVICMHKKYSSDLRIYESNYSDFNSCSIYGIGS